MHYEVKALRGDELTALALEAVDAGDAAIQAQDQGYTVIGIKPKAGWLMWRKPGTGRFALVLFSQELLALLEAGLSLVESLETLADKEQQPEIQKTLRQIITSLYEGHTFSHALQHSPATIPLLYVATVRACEKTGGLPEALSRYVAYQSQMDAVKRQVVSASIYPLLLAGVGALVTLFLMVYVVPRFSHIYGDIGGDLPLMSRLLMRWGQMLDTNGPALLTVTAVALLAAIYTITRPVSKRWMMRKLLKIPSLGGRLHVFQLARFYRSLGMLLRGGMPVVTSLQMVSDLLESSLRGQLALASASIREGHALSKAMDQYGLTTPVASRMLRVGERTGRMGEMMERIAAFYEDETARWVERFTKLFEPLLMVFIGLIIGGIVVLMYVPIFELAGNIQ
ncbi:type II secretion system F family protein [Rhodoferax ferrireducens]|uniref:type II secretion system F family protein n=1 Tax=Rhodoferax ferrireducens TaxID=192843 RepID=UPI000E0DBA4C|nr:type II secretion system F family protein [Rhodoferax ferrireducens]